MSKTRKSNSAGFRPDRRAVLRGLGAGIAMCPICFAAGFGNAAETKHAAAAGHAGAKPHWGYGGEGAPEKWSELSPEYRTCGFGMEQTPVDLRGAVKAELGAVVPKFGEMPLKIVNNGHTIQVNCPHGSHTQVDGRRYELLQFHFHHPSEHLLSGRDFPLECHFVHRAADGGLAVLGVFIRKGAYNSALEPIFAAMPGKEGPEMAVGTSIRPGDLLPANRQFFRYAGSLTTPPCSEALVWTVFKEPVEASEEQIRRFAALFPGNARPVQPMHRRVLLESR